MSVRREGDRDGVLLFYERTVTEVFAYAMRLTGGDRERAEELVQETYLTLVRERRLGSTLPLGIGWAITTCRHRFLDQLRGDRRRRTREARVVGWRRDDTAIVATTEAIDALRLLPDDQRAAMVLRYVDDLAVADVAVAMGRSVHAVESLLARARETLRRRYPTLANDEEVR